MIPQLRPYQTAAIDAIRAEARAGHRSILCVSPVGSGKTTIFSSIAQRHVDQGGRVLVLVHRRELLQQAAARLEAFGVQAAVHTIQTLVAREQRPEASLVILDEAHHFQPDATGWGEFAAGYGQALRLGFTATPERGDGTGLGALFTSLVVAASVHELTTAGHLVRCSVVAPAKPLKSGQIAQRPVDAYLEHARGRRCIVFSPHVKAAVEHACEFRASGVSCAVVEGTMAPLVRARALADYRAGRVPVLCNVNVLTEGFDCPETDAVIIARGIGTPGLFIQIVGRALRPAPGKRDALVLDLRGVVHVHGRPDEDRRYSLEGRAIRRDEDGPAERFCIVCGAVIEGDACTDCGRTPEELEAPRVTKTPLVKFERIRRDTDEERIARLAKWIGQARSKGWNPNQALHRYRAAYGDWPPPDVKRAALALSVSHTR